MFKKILTAVALVTLSFTGKAAIVYTDIAPDSSRILMGSEPFWFDIDFNKDGTEEYNFRWDVDPVNYFVHTTFNVGNEMAVTGAMNAFGAEILSVIDAGKKIDGSLMWKNSSPEPIISENANPNFAGKGDKYIGVRFKLGTNTHYGWILINYTATTNQLIVKSYAYEDVPNTAINAGAGAGTGTTTRPAAAFNAGSTATDTKTAVTFTDASTNAPTTWQWTFTPASVTFTGGTSATSKNPQVLFSAAGKYTVKLKVSNAAGSDSLTKSNYIDVRTPTAIPAYANNDGLLDIFPNPADKVITVQSPSGEGMITILDLNGKAEWSGPVTGKQMQVDISGLPKGYHTLRIVTNEQVTINRKLIVR